jgi:hypothetical protein
MQGATFYGTEQLPMQAAEDDDTSASSPVGHQNILRLNPADVTGAEDRHTITVQDSTSAEERTAEMWSHCATNFRLRIAEVRFDFFISFLRY